MFELYINQVKIMKYTQIENLEIIDAGAEGKAVGKKDGLTVFVPFAVPGDVVDVELFKKKKGYAEARIINIKTKSPYRIEPECTHFGLCGGCKWQIMDYETQLKYKQKQVEDGFAIWENLSFHLFSPLFLH